MLELPYFIMEFIAMEYAKFFDDHVFDCKVSQR